MVTLPNKQRERKTKTTLFKIIKEGCSLCILVIDVLIDFSSDLVFYTIKQVPASDLKKEFYLFFLTHFCDYKVFFFWLSVYTGS